MMAGGCGVTMAVAAAVVALLLCVGADEVLAGSKVKANVAYCNKHPSECSHPEDQSGFVIGIGVQKSGTSSLAGFLNKLDGVVKMRKEMHFFDRNYVLLKDEIEADREQGLKKALQVYHDRWGPQPFADGWLPMEITPVYMYDRRVAYRMMEVLRPKKDGVRLIAVLRNPVPRAYSGFFQLDEKVDPKDFHDLVAAEVDVIRKCYIDGLMFVNEQHCHPAEYQYEALRKCVEENVADGRPWYERFIIPLNNNASKTTNDNGYSYWLHEGILLRGMYADQLKNFLCAGWKPEQIFITTTTHMHTEPLDMTQRLAKFIGPPAKLAGKFKQRLKAGDTIHRGSKTAGHPPMEERTQRLLTEFYEEYNEALVHLLRQHNFACDVAEVERELGLLVRTRAERESDDDDDGGDDDDNAADDDDDVTNK
ncbi:hypothetical protein PTSG_10785 [Salpingoeca rosetta]|uniref:Sulfotransferase domain-containing protein n=1 Tax=Salpingoeca rosetta (strain ATCC 50818 / BSB-021) TaxID=946362 RepID=F2UPX2_SALR5|nr:uncharacterized protein PTSG_10785 [Salpingoeca rosetta]EGD79802.1 hypothetical protein PTSG_10785 [Salpingoeca rosetta]|eukprot:XP_004988751.1 hypothetical protein PTSG_10785 [Salpingoeca rosetta]